MTSYKDTPYMQKYSNFTVVCLNPEQHEQTCGYWYTVSSGAMAHTAFATSEELVQWLGERGLKLTGSLPAERGTWKVIGVEGSYNRASYLNVGAFVAIVPLRKIAVMDNAEYTLGKVTEDAHGIRTVHHLNTNVRARVVFPYFEVRNGTFDARFIEESPDIDVQVLHPEYCLCDECATIRFALCGYDD